MAPKTVFITGASSGIGRATAVYFQQQGWQVAATMRSPSAGRELAALGNVLVSALDVTDEESIQAAVRGVEERFGAIDVLVNNAGHGVYGVLEATPVESIRRQFETNVVGMLATTRAVLPGMRRRRSGVVVNISSIIGRLPFPFSSAYCGSKFAVEGLSEALSLELGAIGVRVKIVEPGIIFTNFATAMEFHNTASLQEYQPLLGRFNGRIGEFLKEGVKPELVAEVIYRAATDGSDKLRYLAGDDAQRWQVERGSMNDDEYFRLLQKRYQPE